MPSSVKQAVAHYDFTRANLANIMQVADDVYQSTRPASASIAAMAALPSAPNPHNDLSNQEVLNQAFTMADSPEAASAQIASLAAQVAAMQKKFSRGNGRGGRGQGRGGNRGGGQQPQYNAANPRHKSPRHPDLPPFGACKRHWQFGKSSFVCLEPETCPWKRFIAPKPQTN